MVKRQLNLLIAVFVLFSISLVSAEIVLTQPESIYNFGDEINLNVTIRSGTSSTNFLIANIVCGEKVIEVFRNSEDVKANENNKVSINIKIDNSILGGLSGNCTINVSFPPDSKTSATFLISKLLDIRAEIVNPLVNPGEKVVVRGEVKKANNKAVDGELKAEIPDINLASLNNVANGKFNFSIEIPENAKSGKHILKIYSFERNSAGEPSNEGQIELTFLIKQIVKKIEIANDKNELLPYENLSFGALLYDQAGEKVEEEVNLIVYGPSGDVVFNKVGRAGVVQNFFLDYNSTPGVWTLETKYKGLSAKKNIVVLELEKISFRIENKTIVISNIGNVPYKKPVEIKIGDKTSVKEIELGVGDSKTLYLKAPDGEYNISIKEGDKISSVGAAFLTGRAISISEYQLLEDNGLIWLWIIIIILLAAISAIYYIRTRKKKYYGREPKTKEIKTIKISPAPLFNTSSQSIIDRGKKENASIIAIKIKNFLNLQDYQSAVHTINSSLIMAKEKKAKVYIEGDYRLVILTKSLTGNDDNNMTAINTAENIKHAIDSFNKQSLKKIEYGIGVHCGEIIAESHQGKFKFSSVGNLIPVVKRIAEYSKGEILLSEILHRRLSGKIKSEKISSLNLWKIVKTTDRGGYKEFIDKFMKRQK